MIDKYMEDNKHQFDVFDYEEDGSFKPIFMVGKCDIVQPVDPIYEVMDEELATNETAKDQEPNQSAPVKTSSFIKNQEDLLDVQIMPKKVNEKKVVPQYVTPKMPKPLKTLDIPHIKEVPPKKLTGKLDYVLKQPTNLSKKKLVTKKPLEISLKTRKPSFLDK